METTLHRQLKDHYAGPEAEIEVPLGKYRIDIVDGARLIEVQHSGLSSIRDKVRQLLKKHEVEVIKPVIARKRLITLNEKGGSELRRRWSPKRCTPMDMFHELVYFTSVFPHKRLTLRIPLIEICESRFPHTRRNKRRSQFKVQDQELIRVVEENVYRAPADLSAMLPASLPATFGTLEIAQSLGVDRWVAQRIAYCLRNTGATKIAGKDGNAVQYRWTAAAKKSRPKSKKATTTRKKGSKKNLSKTSRTRSSKQSAGKGRPTKAA